MYRTADVKAIIQNILIAQEFSCSSKFETESFKLTTSRYIYYFKCKEFPCILEIVYSLFEMISSSE